MNRCIAVASLSLVGLAGCFASCAHQTMGVTAPAVTPTVSAAKPESMLAAMKSLEGEWTQTDEKGVVTTAAVFKTTSNGSVVREIMFPGAAHEMTNMYHMDGKNLIATHYCAAGNQPRMRAVAADGKSIAFGPDSVTNLAKPDDTYMGSMVVTFVDADHVTVDWTSLKNGKPDASHNVKFTMARKK